MSTSGAGRRQHYGVTLGVLTVSALAYALSQTLVAPALPAIQADLGVSTTAISFVVTAYLLSASVATPIVGRLGDMFGKERILVCTLSCVGLGSLVAALSGSIEMLIVGRVIQGVGGGVFPLSFAIIRDEFPRHRTATGIGLISATFGVGGAAGLVLSGLIVEALAYEALFWLSVPMVIFAIAMTHLFIPESPVRDRVPIDWVGAALLSSGLIAILVAISEGASWGWLSLGATGLGLAGFAVLGVWLWFEERHPAPMVDMRMMRRKAVWTANAASLCLGFAMFATFILIPQLVQLPVETGYGFGAGVVEAGLFLLPGSAFMLVAGPAAGWLGDRIGSKLPLAIGTSVAGLSFALMAVGHQHPAAVLVASSLFGIGIGFSFASVANLIVEAVEQRMTGVATGINTIMRTMGGAIGGQVAAATLASTVLASGLPQAQGFVIAFAAAGAACALALAFALLAPGPLVGRRVPEIGLSARSVET